MREGEIIKAIVVGVHKFGVELESEGRKGLIQPIEVDWGAKSPEDVDGLRIGHAIDVLIYSVTSERFYASLKRAHPELDPWRDPTKFAPGSRHSGIIVATFDWGYKVALVEGVDGLILVGATSDRRYQVGDRVKVEVAQLDATLRKIELRALASPGEEAAS